MIPCPHDSAKWPLCRKSAIRKYWFLTKLSFSARLPCQLYTLRHIAVCRVTWKQSLSFGTDEATLPVTHSHPSLSSAVGAGKYILIFSPKSIFIDVAWLHIYFDDVHSVSFKLINSLLFFCPSCILNGAFPYSFLSGIFHPMSLMKFIFFSST